MQRKVASFKGIIVSRSQKVQKSGVVWKPEPELERRGMIINAASEHMPVQGAVVTCYCHCIYYQSCH